MIAKFPKIYILYCIIYYINVILVYSIDNYCGRFANWNGDD